MGRALMVQGTASHVGKSVIVTGLCRIFAQEGLRVAPFKAQNMSLNSGVTPDGGEIARAQLVQAEAAGVEPSVHMNPVLLKPEGDRRSQLIVHGKVAGVLEAEEYQRRLQELAFPAMEHSLHHLLQRFDIVIIEGAGSPAEVNLRDVANMVVASLARAPVLLVTDIERGGALAAVVGTLELLAQEDRQRIRGLLINKFRGERTLLASGLRFLEQRTAIPVLGVIPFIPELGVLEEDSLGVHSTTSGRLALTVIRLPHIANFTDFAPLERAARLRYLPLGERIGSCDAILLPGTKNTSEDLLALRRSGTADQLLAAARLGIPLVGICGGYQMLGHAIRDPEGIESAIASIEGLALLPVHTTLQRPKVTHQVEATVEMPRGPFTTLSGARLHGYEIHAGRSEVEGSVLLRIRRRSGRPVDVPDGAISADGRMFGVSLHGLFENASFRTAFMRWLAASPSEPPSEDAYDRLAHILRMHLNLPALFSLMDFEALRWAQRQH